MPTASGLTRQRFHPAGRGGSSPSAARATGWCLEPHDLAYSKLAARRPKDLAFVTALLQHKLVKRAHLQSLIASTTDAALRSNLADALAICLRDA
jgi:hypothetical protein